MKFSEDPRMKVARKCLAISWIFFSLYLIAVMSASYMLGVRPYVWGLPRWMAIGNILIPAIFVVLLIFVIEKFIPDVSLLDEDDGYSKDEK